MTRRLLIFLILVLVVSALVHLFRPGEKPVRRRTPVPAPVPAPNPAIEPVTEPTPAPAPRTLPPDFDPDRWVEEMIAIREDGKEAEPADLLPALGHGDSTVRYWTARALGRIGSADGPEVDALAARLDDEDRLVRLQVVESLGEIGLSDHAILSRITALLAHGWFPLSEQASFALAEIGAPALPHLEREIRSGSVDRAYEAILVLARMGDEALGLRPLVLEGITDPDPWIRSGSLRALDRIDPFSHETWATLDRAVFDPLPYIGSRAAGIVFRRSDREFTIALLAKLARAGPPGHRLRLIDILLEHAPRARGTRAWLEEAQGDEDPWVRLAALRELNRILAREKGIGKARNLSSDDSRVRPPGRRNALYEFNRGIELRITFLRRTVEWIAGCFDGK